MLKTRKGYDFGEVASAMRKAIRHNQPGLAGWFALELFQSGHKEYDAYRIVTKGKTKEQFFKEEALNPEKKELFDYLLEERR